MSSGMLLEVCLREDIDVTPNDDDQNIPNGTLLIEDDIQSFSLNEINGHLEGVMEGFRDMETLHRFHVVMEKYDSFPNEARQLLYLGIDSVTKRYPMNTFSRSRVLAIESESSTQALSVAKESLSESMKAIWEAIVRTMKAIWEKIKQWIGFGARQIKESINDTKKIKTDLEKVQEVIKEPTTDEDKLVIIEKMKTGNGLRGIDNQYLQEAFAFIGREPDFNDMMGHLGGLTDLSNRIRYLIDTSSDTSSFLRKNFYELSRSPWAPEKSADERRAYQAAADQAAIYDLQERIERQVGKPSNDPQIDSRIIEETHNFENLSLSVDSIRVLDGFTFGGKVFFFKSNDKTDANYYILAASKIQDKDELAVVTALGTDQLTEYLDVLEDLQGKVGKLQRHYEFNYEYIQKYHRDIINLLNDVFERNKRTAPENLDYSSFDSIRSATKAVMRLAAETAKANAMFSETIQDCTRYAKICLSEIQKQTKELKE